MAKKLELPEDMTLQQLRQTPCPCCKKALITAVTMTQYTNLATDEVTLEVVYPDSDLNDEALPEHQAVRVFCPAGCDESDYPEVPEALQEAIRKAAK